MAVMNPIVNPDAPQYAPVTPVQSMSLEDMVKAMAANRELNYQVAHPEDTEELHKLHRDILKHQMDAYKLTDTHQELTNRAAAADARTKQLQAVQQAAIRPGSHPTMGFPQPDWAGGGPMQAAPDEMAATLPETDLGGGVKLPAQPVPYRYADDIKDQGIADQERQNQMLVDMFSAKAEATAKAKADNQPDKFGSSPMGIFNTGTGRITTANPNAAGMGEGALTNAVASTFVDPTTGRNEELLSKFPPGEQSLVKGAADYELDPTKINSLRGDARKQFIEKVKLYDPTFDMTQYPVKTKLRSSFIGDGQAAQSIRSINTAVDHLDKLSNSFDKLSNTQFPLVNYSKNTVKSSVLGKAGLNRFKLDAEAVSTELGRIFKGSGVVPESEIAHFRSAMSGASSPEDFKDVMQEAFRLMSGRAASLRDQYQSGLNKPYGFSVVSPTAAKVLNRLGMSKDDLDGLIGDGTPSPALTGLRNPKGANPATQPTSGKAGRFTYEVEP